MSKFKINLHPPAAIDPVESINYSTLWFQTQWAKMNTGQVLLTLDGSYIKTKEGFDQF